MTDPEILTTVQAAELLHVKPRALLRMVRVGSVRAHALGPKVIRFIRSELALTVIAPVSGGARPEPRVYFIQAGAKGAIKIGVARDVERRLRSLQTGSHVRLHLRGTVPGGYERERRIHAIFTRLRLVGEWFAPHKELLDFIWRTL